MFLAVDAGNSNISFALFSAGGSPEYWDLATRRYSRSALLKKIGKKRINAGLVCSVVPALNKKICSDISDLSGIRPGLIGRDLRVPIRSLYRNRRQLGQDRQVNAYAASRIYPGALIVVSCGTAITIDAISRDKTHLGGWVQPGLRLSLSALSANTALLPQLKLSSVKGVIGRDTGSGILNGVILGTCAGIDTLVRKLKTHMGEPARVIGTGGDVKLVSRFTQVIDKIEPQLTLKGIFLLYKNEAKKG